MVAFSYSMLPAKYLIPADLKRSTIRCRNLKKEDQIERIGVLQHYWHQRSSDCELLGVRNVKKLTIIERPILEFIARAPPEVIYCEGFGSDRYAMENFFVSNHGQRIHAEGQFYMVEWYPERNGEAVHQ